MMGKLKNRCFGVISILILCLGICHAQGGQPQNQTGTEIEMVFVKGGVLKIDTSLYKNKYIWDDSTKTKPFTIQDFYIGKYEITQRQWMEVMGYNPSFFKYCPECPVECVSYEEIMDFIERLNIKHGKKYRLPTYFEWFFAAKGGNLVDNGYVSSNPDNLGEIAWFGRNSNNSTHEKGLKKSNSLGIYDMLGNVEEFCSDIYPMNFGKDYVICGGSWLSPISWINIYKINGHSISSKNYYVGFRLVLEK